MNANNIAVWVGIIVAILGGGVSYGVNSEKISQLEEKTENQQVVREQQIRMEERQKTIQKDVQDTKQSLDEIKQLIQGISR